MKCLTGKLTSGVKVRAVLIILHWTGALVDLQGEVTVQLIYMIDSANVDDASEIVYSQVSEGNAG